MTDPHATQESSVANPPVETLVSTDEIDASCRWPVLFLFVKGIFWLLVSGVLWLVSMAQMMFPGFWNVCPWITVGHVGPAAWNVFIYGFLVQAGLGAVLWVQARLGNSPLRHGIYVIMGGAIWNLGVLAGLVGVLYGDNTSYSWFEFPKYATPILFLSYGLMAAVAVLNFARRNRREIYVSQWFLLAALFWFPWIYSTAILLLQVHPVRGVVQVVVDGWFKSNFGGVWLGCVGLGLIYYIFPKSLNRPLYSRNLANLGFWMTLFVAGWHVVEVQSPVPSWIASASAASTLLMLPPLLALATNLIGTWRSGKAEGSASVDLLFGWYAAGSYAVANLALLWGSRQGVAQEVRFTLFGEGWQFALLYGFGAMSLFAGIHHIIPRLLGEKGTGCKCGMIHFWTSATGVALLAFVFMFGGMQEGRMLNDPQISFDQVSGLVRTCFCAATMGILLLLSGSALLMAEIGGVLLGRIRACVSASVRDWLGTAGKPVEARP